MAANEIGKSWVGFGAWSVWIMAIYALVTFVGLEMWGVSQNHRISDVAKRNANSTKWNHFWNMVDNKVAVSDDTVGQFAKKLRRDVACDRAKKYAEGPLTALYRDGGSYPGLTDTFGYLLMTQQNGGPFRPAFTKQIERYRKGGLQTVLRPEPGDAFLLEDDAYVQRVKDWNTLWKSVDGKPVTFSSKGLALLADDVRGYVHGKMGKLSWTWLVDSGEGYAGLEDAIGNYDILTDRLEGGGEDWGEFTTGFQSCVNDYRDRGLTAVLQPLEPVPLSYPTLPFGVGRLIFPPTLPGCLMLWLLGSTIALTVASFVEPPQVKDDEDLGETAWRWAGVAAALPAVAVRETGRLAWRPVAYGISRGVILVFIIREWRHPYRKQRATARGIIRRLTPLAKHSQDAQSQLERARETLSDYDRLLGDAEARKVQDTLDELKEHLVATDAAAEEVVHLFGGKG